VKQRYCRWTRSQQSAWGYQAQTKSANGTSRSRQTGTRWRGTRGWPRVQRRTRGTQSHERARGSAVGPPCVSLTLGCSPAWRRTLARIRRRRRLRNYPPHRSRWDLGGRSLFLRVKSPALCSVACGGRGPSHATHEGARRWRHVQQR
jgi:hypothetical protein